MARAWQLARPLTAVEVAVPSQKVLQAGRASTTTAQCRGSWKLPLISTRSMGFEIGICQGSNLVTNGYAECQVELGANCTITYAVSARS